MRERPCGDDAHPKQPTTTVFVNKLIFGCVSSQFLNKHPTTGASMLGVSTLVRSIAWFWDSVAAWVSLS